MIIPGQDFRLKNVKFVEDLPMIIPVGFNYPSGFREEAF